MDIAAKTRQRRLALNISQQELADRSGISLGSVKRFETSGLISLASLLEIALVLGSLHDFEAIFSKTNNPESLFTPEPKMRLRSGRKKK
ncbi:MAG: helix-turn-helix transcriptional regulator [Desulfobulbus sp.]|nr:helix-turn-helix transcriptional regulator [Desulfobulbus sp.]